MSFKLRSFCIQDERQPATLTFTKAMGRELTQDMAHDAVALVGELLLAEELSLALQPAACLHPARLLDVLIVRRDVACAMHLLHQDTPRACL